LDNIKRIADNPVWAENAAPPDPDDAPSTPENISYMHKTPEFQARAGNAPPKDAPLVASREEAIAWFNIDHFTIYIKGKFRANRENPDGSLEIIEVKDFIRAFTGMKLLQTSVEGRDPKSVPITEIWLNALNERRHFKYGFDFDPSFIGNRSGKYNLWKGWNIKPKEGDVSQWLDFTKTIICSGDDDYFKFLNAIIENMITTPHLKPGVAVVIRGDEGVGRASLLRS
jgi:hypothetical protein